MTALVALAGGFVAGMLLAPDTGAKTREKLSNEAKAQLARLDGQLSGLTGQLESLQQQINEASETIAHRVRDVAEKTVAAADEKDEDQWEVHDEDVSGDLRRMPRK